MEPPQYRVRTNEDKTPLWVGAANFILAVVQAVVAMVVAMIRAIFGG
jgi:hypothetical protein